MAKIQLGPTTNLFPMPCLLIAVKTGDDPNTGQPLANILTVAWAGIVWGNPPMLALEIGSSHYSTPYIERAGEFTANVPSSAQAVGADYCGMVSGRKDPNKPGTCGWTLQAASKITSPIIAECPLNFECRVVRKVKVSDGKSFYLAEIVETHVEETIVDGKNIDAIGLDPLIFTADGYYHKLGERVGKAWSIGKALK